MHDMMSMMDGMGWAMGLIWFLAVLVLVLVVAAPGRPRAEQKAATVHPCGRGELIGHRCLQTNAGPCGPRRPRRGPRTDHAKAGFAARFMAGKPNRGLVFTDEPVKRGHSRLRFKVSHLCT